MKNQNEREPKTANDITKILIDDLASFEATMQPINDYIDELEKMRKSENEQK